MTPRDADQALIAQLRQKVEDQELEILGLRRIILGHAEEAELALLQRNLNLTDTEARLIMRLYEAKPNTVSRSRLLDAVYGQRADEPAEKIIDVYVCKLRKKIGKDMVETLWGRGWRLSAVGQAAVYKALHNQDETPSWLKQGMQA